MSNFNGKELYDYGRYCAYQEPIDPEFWLQMETDLAALPEERQVTEDLTVIARFAREGIDGVGEEILDLCARYPSILRALFGQD